MKMRTADIGPCACIVRQHRLVERVRGPGPNMIAVVARAEACADARPAAAGRARVAYRRGPREGDGGAKEPLGAVSRLPPPESAALASLTALVSLARHKVTGSVGEARRLVPPRDRPLRALHGVACSEPTRKYKAMGRTDSEV